MKVKVPGGWKIRSHTTGKLYPKIYRTAEEADARIIQMLKFKNMRRGKK